MNTRKIILFYICTLFSLSLFAQDLEIKKTYFQGYSGGMMLHTGYVSGGKINVSNLQEKIDVQGFPFGVGGVLRFHFGKHLRIGGEGYSSNLRYGKNKSFLYLGWGGFLIDCQWEIKKFTVFCGGTLGGGSVKNVAITNTIPANPLKNNALYRKYAVMLIDPFIGMEYAVSSKLHLIAKVDCIVPLNQKRADFPIGVRVYAGVVFFHSRQK